MIKLKIKALSVNQVWQGRRFKTPEYGAYEQEMIYILPRLKIPPGKLFLRVVVGFSNKSSDLDNVLKPFIDILQKKYNFNDKMIYKIEIEKVDVKKEKEYIAFQIEGI